MRRWFKYAAPVAKKESMQTNNIRETQNNFVNFKALTEVYFSAFFSNILKIT